ncbi:MAG: FGGY family carbohydrate kinase [Actinomycetota bacterium]
MSDLLLAIDQGTSSTRCFVIGRDLGVRAVASRPVASSYPQAGWVEQDPEQLVSSAVEAVAEAMDQAAVGWDAVRAIGIDNQTETFLVWDRETGRPVYPAIVWQDRRTADVCDRLRDEGREPLIRARTGLELDPSFSATKLAWVLEARPEAAEAARAGRLAFGDVACWLIWRLSGGRAHVTEPSNASRSMLLDLHTLAWDGELLELFGIPRSLLPPIRPTASVLAETSPEVVGATVPIAGALGDQQAALFGQQCWRPGMAKVTLGTGAFLWMNAGPKVPDPPPGILGTVGWMTDDEVAYALEGFVPVAGAAVSWMVETGLLPSPGDSEAAARAVDDDASTVWFVPALTGLGAPSWEPSVRGTILGIGRGTRREEIVRGALDGVVHQIADALEAMEEGLPTGLEGLRVDGGMAKNDWLMQRLADILARPVERPSNPEATGLGAASVAGLATGLWSSREELADLWVLDRRFDPGMDGSKRDGLRASWARAVELATSWT